MSNKKRYTTTKKWSLLIDKHQLCIEILEGVKYFEKAIELKKYSINGFSGTFPELRRKYIHDVDIYERCVKRLKQRYDVVLNEC